MTRMLNLFYTLNLVKKLSRNIGLRKIIFMNASGKDELKSFALPFAMLEHVKLEQPLLGANYLKGGIQGLPGGNFEGVVEWKLVFPKGGCIEFGQALLRANAMAKSTRFENAPPMYTEPGAYFSAPTNYYMTTGGQINGFQAPINVFPEQPPVGSVYMYEKPPPYAGIAPPQFMGPPPAAGWNPAPPQHQYPNSSVPPYPGAPAAGSEQPPAYSPYATSSNQQQQAGPLPEKYPIP